MSEYDYDYDDYYHGRATRPAPRRGRRLNRSGLRAAAGLQSGGWKCAIVGVQWQGPV